MEEDFANWFLTSDERSNVSTAIDRRRPDGLAWTVGNRVENLVHGATYFGRLLQAIRELNAGDQLFFTDWRGDPDQLLDGTKGSEIGTVLVDAARRGASVKGLLWRSHARAHVARHRPLRERPHGMPPARKVESP